MGSLNSPKLTLARLPVCGGHITGEPVTSLLETSASVSIKQGTKRGPVALRAVSPAPTTHVRSPRRPVPLLPVSAHSTLPPSSGFVPAAPVCWATPSSLPPCPPCPSRPGLCLGLPTSTPDGAPPRTELGTKQYAAWLRRDTLMVFSSDGGRCEHPVFQKRKQSRGFRDSPEGQPRI